MSPRRRPTTDPDSWAGGRLPALLALLVVLVVGAPAAGAVSITPLDLSPVAGDVSRTSPNDRVFVESRSLELAGGAVTGAVVDVTNLDGADASGLIDLRLVTLDGTVVATDDVTVYVQKNGKTARCTLALDAPRPPESFAIAVVSVDTTVDATRQNADCDSTGPPPGQGPPAGQGP